MFEIHSKNTLRCNLCGARMVMDYTVLRHAIELWGLCPGTGEQPARQYILHWLTYLKNSTLTFFIFHFHLLMQYIQGQG